MDGGSGEPRKGISQESLDKNTVTNNARAKSTGDRVIELLALSEPAQAGETKGAARLT